MAEYRVLVTGFGPFREFKENPSWLAVRLLHGTTIQSASPNDPDAKPASIHITTLEIPVVYDTILSTVPGLHARPPKFPSTTASQQTFPTPPPDGYDFILHVGVGGCEPLRLEVQGHKLGYDQPDHEGKFAGVVDESVVPPIRGFGKKYDAFGEELKTSIDIGALIDALEAEGLTSFESRDAGHFLCDFTYYCSLAEAQRAAAVGKTPAKPVLFLHCSPVNMPTSTEEVAEGVRRIVAHVCGGFTKSARSSRIRID